MELGEQMGTNNMMIESFNQIVLPVKEKEVFANFSKMIPPFMQNILSFLPQNSENFQLPSLREKFSRGTMKANKNFCES